jgi:uncharacterized protein
MEKRLPSRFNAAALGRTTTLCTLELPVSHFERFAALLLDDSGSVRASVQFDVSQDGVPTASGSLESQVRLTCQRCLAPMEHQITTAFSFGFVASESAADDLPDYLDPVLTDEAGEVVAVEMFEDELILQLPLSTLHAEDENCVPLGRAGVAEPAPEPGGKTYQPFSALGDMLKRDDG